MARRGEVDKRKGRQGKALDASLRRMLAMAMICVTMQGLVGGGGRS